MTQTFEMLMSQFKETLLPEHRDKYAGVEGKYYTYVLMRPDGSVFYVGKGTGSRIDAHERDARNGVVSYKCNTIRSIWAQGEQVIKQKVAFFDDEADAYELEILLIKFFGRKKLTNGTNGGEGGSTGKKTEHVNWTISKEVVQALRQVTDNQSGFVDTLLREHPKIQAVLKSRKENKALERIEQNNGQA